MKAYVTTIGESTTQLCIWSLERLGFEVIIHTGDSSLWQKLYDIFEEADDDFIRVDADVVVNRNVLELIKLKDLWWYQSLTYDWYKQDLTHGGVQFIRKEAFDAVRASIHEAEHLDRPESYLSRLEALHNPRRFGTFEKVCGLHGYKQLDTSRVKKVKARRGHFKDYDWELSERLLEL